LHLRGELWTFEHAGSVHVFSQPGSASDAALAGRALPDPDHAGPRNRPASVPSRGRQAPSQNPVIPGLFVP